MPVEKSACANCKPNSICRWNWFFEAEDAACWIGFVIRDGELGWFDGNWKGKWPQQTPDHIHQFRSTFSASADHQRRRARNVTADP